MAMTVNPDVGLSAPDTLHPEGLYAFRFDLNGGSPVEIVHAQQGRGGAWGAGGLIVYSPAPTAPLMKVNAAGGTAEPLTKLDASQHTSHRWPVLLPDGKHFLCSAIHHDPAKAGNDALYCASLDGRENRLLIRMSSNAIYAGGFLLFAQGSSLMAQSFDPARGALKGDPQPIATGVINDPTTWHMDVSAAENGLLAFDCGAIGTRQLVWLDRSGKDAGMVAENVGLGYDMRLSPQGDKVAVRIDSAGVADIWVLDLGRGVKTRLTFGPVTNYAPTWSPDGKWIYYSMQVCRQPQSPIWNLSAHSPQRRECPQFSVPPAVQLGRGFST